MGSTSTTQSRTGWQAWWIRGVLLAVALAWLSGNLFAQLPQTRVYALFPAGGQSGTSVDVTLTRGDDIDDVNRLLFSHPGITAVQKTTMSASGQSSPIPNQFTVTIAPNTPAGQYEVRAVGVFGISNPRAFSVGSRAESLEIEPNNTREQATPVELETTVNGRVNGATDVDFLKFVGAQGQRVILDCAAQRIDSRLDATLELHDATGRRLAAARNNVSRDAVLDVTLPAAGEYYVRLTDFVYAGSEDYFYRLTLRTSAFVDFVDPPAGVPGTTTKFTLYGRNLPQGQPTEIKVDGHPLQKQVVDIAIPQDHTQAPQGLLLEPYAAGTDGFSYALPTPQGPSNSIMIGFSTSPVVSEVEPNNLPTAPQKITAPIELAGAFQQRGDVDLYQFEAKAGQIFWLEVQGQRLGSGCDPYLTIDQVTTAADGQETLKRITAVDDNTTNLLPILFETVHDDPAAKFTAPADGVYRIALRDRYGASRGSPTLQYRLTIRPEQPDFRVVLVTDSPQLMNQKVPSTWSAGLRRGDHFRVWALVIRRDGFTGDVQISAEGLPPGVLCQPISVGTTPSQGILVFESKEDAPAWAGTVRVIGKARIADPVKVAAVVQAEAGLKTARDAVTAATKAAEKPAQDFTQATAAVEAAKTELAAKADDAGLQKKLADAEAKLAAVKPAHDTAQAAVAAAIEKVTAAEQQVATATTAREAATQEVTRVARSGTISWSGQNNIPGRARLSSGLELSVIEELAPFQVTTAVTHYQANHGRQIMIPVKAIRRDKFDADINMTFVGQPANVQIENKPIKKGASEELYRVFVPPNAAVGTYVVYLAAQAQVPYQRNPQKAARLKTELEQFVKSAADAVAVQKTATMERDQSLQKLTAAQAELKKAVDAKAAAEKVLTAAQAAEKQAADAVGKAGEAQAEKQAAAEQLTKAQSATKAAMEELTKLEAARVAAETAQKSAEAAKAAADMALKAADDKVKATAAEKTAAEKRFTDADTAAKPKNINFLPTTQAITLVIQAAPYTLTATPADGGKLKRGGKVDVKVTVKRQNDFAGPVTLTVAPPPNLVGITAAPVTIPADQSEGVLTIEAAADATEGALTNLVVRARSQYHGEAAVDQAVTISVSK